MVGGVARAGRRPLRMRMRAGGRRLAGGAGGRSPRTDAASAAQGRAVQAFYERPRGPVAPSVGKKRPRRLGVCEAEGAPSAQGSVALLFPRAHVRFAAPTFASSQPHHPRGRPPFAQNPGSSLPLCCPLG